MVMRIYFPMTCNILTPGHIQCLEWLSVRGDVVVGLLNSNALKGYKKEIVPFKDRKFVLEAIVKGKPNIKIVSQNSLNPSYNIKKYRCNTIASGDGWEPVELKVANKLNLKVLDIKLPGEKFKKYSSSNLIV